MGFFSRFENKMEDTFDDAADKVFDAPISPVQIAKKAERQMRRGRMVGAGKQYAPTLYTILVNLDDDERLFGYYPTLAGETETYLDAKAAEQGMVMDGRPLVRFVVDDSLKPGKFDVIAEAVAAPIIEQLRQEEMEHYGITQSPQAQQAARPPRSAYPAQAPAQRQAPAQSPAREPVQQPAQQPEQAQPAARPPLPYVPEEEIDRSIDYGEYTFRSEDFDDRGYEAQQHAQAYENQGDYVQDQAGYARLIDSEHNMEHDLVKAHMVIGRESKNDISVPDPNASRTHAELRLDAQGVWSITDLGSTNGTMVNGRAIATQPLRNGDRITVGKTELVFLQS